MINVMQLKAFIRNEAADKGIPAQVVLQNYMPETSHESVCEAACEITKSF